MNASLHPGDAGTAEPRTGAFRSGPAAGRCEARRERRGLAGLLPARSRDA